MRRFLSLTIAGVVIFLSSCSGAGATGDEEADAIVMGVPNDVTGRERDPALTAGGTAVPFLFSVFDTLYKFDKSGKPNPNIVTSDELSPDKLKFTMTIKDGLTFHNGEELTSEDVKVSLDRARGADKSLDGPSNMASLAAIDAVQAPDPSTVVLTLAHPDPVLRNSLAYLGGMVVPADYLDEAGNDGFLDKPVGSGPFRMTGAVAGQRIDLEAFAKYQGQPKAAFEQITLRILDESATRVAQLQAGDIDVMMDADVNVLDTLRNADLRVETNPSGQVLSVLFNGKNAAFADKRVRQAFNYGIDHAGIVKTVYQKSAGAVGSNDPTVLSGAGPEPYPYDPEKAKALLAEAGYTADRPLVLDYPSGRYPQDQKLMQVVQANLDAIGVKVKLRAMDPNDWITKLSANKLDDMSLTLNANTNYDPVVTLTGSATCEGPWSLWCDKALDRKLRSAAPLAGEQRAKSLTEVNDQLREDPPAIYLVNVHQVFAMKKTIDWQPIDGIRSGSLTNLRQVSE